MSLSLAPKASTDNISYLKVPVNGGFIVKKKNSLRERGKLLLIFSPSFSLPRPATIHKAGGWRVIKKTESLGADSASPVLPSWCGEG